MNEKIIIINAHESRAYVRPAPGLETKRKSASLILKLSSEMSSFP